MSDNEIKFTSYKVGYRTIDSGGMKVTFDLTAELDNVLNAGKLSAYIITDQEMEVIVRPK